MLSETNLNGLQGVCGHVNSSTTNHNGFDLHFPGDSWCQAPFHTPVGHSCVSVGKIAIQEFCPFFKTLAIRFWILWGGGVVVVLCFGLVWFCPAVLIAKLGYTFFCALPRPPRTSMTVVSAGELLRNSNEIWLKCHFFWEALPDSSVRVVALSSLYPQQIWPLHGSLTCYCPYFGRVSLVCKNKSSMSALGPTHSWCAKITGWYLDRWRDGRTDFTDAILVLRLNSTSMCPSCSLCPYSSVLP